MTAAKTCSFTSPLLNGLALRAWAKGNELLRRLSRAAKGWKRSGFAWSRFGRKPALNGSHDCVNRYDARLPVAACEGNDCPGCLSNPRLERARRGSAEAQCRLDRDGRGQSLPGAAWPVFLIARVF